MNLFKDYQPLKANKRKKRQLSAKIAKLSRTSPNKRRMNGWVKASIAIAAVCLLVIGFNYIGNDFDLPVDNQTASEQETNAFMSRLTFTGESDHWRAVNKVYVYRHFYQNKAGALDSNHFETGVFGLYYKGKPFTGDFRVTIKGPADKMIFGKPGISQYSDFFAPPIFITEAGSYATAPDDTIKVKVEWQNKQEVFHLSSSPEAYHHREVTQTQSLSPVHYVSKRNVLMGIAGGGTFKIASDISAWPTVQKIFNGHMDRGEKQTIPSILAAYGDRLSQVLFFMFETDHMTKDIKIIGKHSGESRTLYTLTEDDVFFSDRLSSDLIMPAVVSFQQPGIWQLQAVSHGEVIGELTVNVYQKRRLKEQELASVSNHSIQMLTSSLAAEHLRAEEGYATVGMNARLQLTMRGETFMGQTIQQPYPILLAGIPLQGGEPFIKVIPREDIETIQQEGSKTYRFKTRLPIEEPGKWAIKGFMGGHIVFHKVLWFQKES